VAIDYGLRWELMWVGTRLHFSNQLAPRVGIAWDALGGGRSRLWASYARTHAMLPAGLGATVIQRDATVEDFELGSMTARLHDAGAPFRVGGDVAPITQDELTLGAQVALGGALRATLWGQVRLLRDGLETIGSDLDNPGRDDPAISDATREAEVIAASLEMMQAERIAIRGGVMWGRAVGTWAGPHDPRLGANLLQSPDWDESASNLYGHLPSDPGARAFVEAEHRRTHGGVAIAVASRLSVGSGRPRDVLADGADGLVQLLPRGAGGRNPVIAQANLRLAARWRGVTATLDVFNVFDRRDATNLDEVYSDDLVRPIEGGDAGDLVFLKDEGGAPARRRTAYQLPTAFQAPLAIALGVHKAF
jgi:outer membrane receptor protein involved in Fe transport